MPRQTLKILNFEGGRNDKVESRDIQDNELAEARNVDVSNPGYIGTSGIFTAASSIADNTTVGAFSANNANLYAFAHDYELAFTLLYDDGDEEIVVGDTITGADSGASGVVVKVTNSGGWTNGTGTLYLINVTGSGETAPFTNSEELIRTGGSPTAANANSTGSAPAVSTSPVVVLSDAEKVDFQDEATNLWYTSVLDLGTSTSNNITNYYYYDGALRVSDGNHANTGNTPQWFGHIKKDMMENILAYDESAGTNKPKLNTWVKDTLAPGAPVSSTQPLRVYDSYSEAYPAANGKVLLKFRERTADALAITAITVSSDTNTATATCSNHSSLGFGSGNKIVISGTAHNNGEHEIIGTPSNTTFTFQPTVADGETTILSGTELVQTGDMSGSTGWTAGAGWDVNSTTAGKARYDGSQDNATLDATLNSPQLEAGKHYRLTFTVATADLQLTIEDIDSSNTLIAKTTYATGATHTVTLSPTVSSAGIRLKADNDGAASDLDDVSLQENTGVVRKDTDALNDDLKDKWAFGMSYVYDKEQESLITTGHKWDGEDVSDSDFNEMGLLSTTNYVIDWTSYVNEPECFFSFIYDSRLRMWPIRIKGFKIYMKRVGNSGSEGDWMLFSVVDFEKGQYRVVAGADTWKSLHQHSSNIYQVNNTTSLDEVTNSPLDTYESENFFPPDVDTISASWKTATVVNRTTYAGNVLVDGRTYPDRIIKSALLKPDVFPNSPAYQVDVLASDGDEITHLQGLGDRLFVFKKKSLTVINTAGQSGDFIEATMPNLGAASSRHVCLAEGGVAWINGTGLYFFDGQSTTNLIEDKFKADDWFGFFGTSGLGVFPCIGYSPKDRKLIIKIFNSAYFNYGYTYDFKNKSFMGLAQMHTINVNLSNMVLVPLINELITAQHTGTTASFKKWSSAPQTTVALTHGGTGISTFGFEIRTKDFDFGEPGVRKKIYKVYITYQTGAGSSSESDIAVAYQVNGGFSGTDLTPGILSSLKQFKAVSDCTVDTGVCYLDESKSVWTTAVMRPNVSSEANNIYSFQLFLYHKSGQVVNQNFKINDITIVYRIKPVR